MQVLDSAQAELTRRQQQRPTTLKTAERRALLALGADLRQVWFAPTTTSRDQKELLRALLEEVILAVFRDQYRAHLTLRWCGGQLTELDVNLPRSRPATVRTDEQTFKPRAPLGSPLSRRRHCAGILNRQKRTTARGLRFHAKLVGNLRRHWQIPRFEPGPAHPEDGELVSIQQAAKILNMAPSTLHRWINDGFVAGEQITPGAPWQIRITDELRQRFVSETTAGYVVMQEAT